MTAWKTSRSEIIARFKEAKKGETKICARCEQSRPISTDFTLKLKFYYYVNGQRRERLTPSCECSSNCRDCEVARMVESHRARIVRDVEYRERYISRTNAHFRSLPIDNKYRNEWAKRNRHKTAAHRAAKKAHPQRQVCSVAGCVELGHRHHPDYAKPTEIVWLCSRHHKAAHWKEKYGIDRVAN